MRCITVSVLHARALSGCCEEVRVSCEDRINLYPAAPIRLAIMLHAWTIVERWDEANLLDGSSTGIAMCHIAVDI